MKIKKRLVISNTLTALIPIIVTITGAFIFIIISGKVLNKDVSYENFKKLTSIKTEVFDIASGISKHDSESIEKNQFEKYLEQRLSKLKGKYIITENNSVIAASQDIDEFDAESCAQEVTKQSGQDMVQISGTSYIVELADIKLGYGTAANIILLAPIGENVDILQMLIIVIVGVFIISSIIVNTVNSYLFSKRIIRPVELLKRATTEISRGNLNCEIAEFGDEEILNLCRDFEVMRIQLKDSIRMQVKYDEDRKILVSSISHDLKTPITSIKGYVEGILDNVANTPEKKEFYLKTIYSKAENIDLMIDDLLLYSKLDLNQIPFNFEKTDIALYFNYCIYEVEPELNKSNIEINLENDLKESTFVKIDLERMKRVVMNIIDNSRKYMDKAQGKITIMLRETNLSVIIEIRDNGTGIDKKDIKSIFDRFYRADTARSETKGSGLGLAIAKQIVEGHKGRIWGISHGNEGTSILISLGKIREGL
jgi:signal transduction histidine kinase